MALDVKKKRTRPAKNAAGKFSGETVTALGSLEAEIMALAWDFGRPVSGMEITEAGLYSRRQQGTQPMAFSTVATTLRRLSEKGLLTVGRRPGDPTALSKREARTPYYEPTVGREEMAARILESVSRTLLRRSLYPLITEPAAGRGSPDGSQRDGVDPEEHGCLSRLMLALQQVAETEETDSALGPVSR